MRKIIILAFLFLPALCLAHPGKVDSTGGHKGEFGIIHYHFDLMGKPGYEVDSNTKLNQPEDKYKPAHFIPNTGPIEKPKEPPKDETPYSKFFNLIESSGMDKWVSHVGYDGTWITIKVKNSFFLLEHQIRLQFSQQMHKTANVIFQKDMLIHIIDIMGNEVGGSTWLSGAWIAD